MRKKIKLSETQKTEITKLYDQGVINKEIAERLNLPFNSVMHFIYSVKKMSKKRRIWTMSDIKNIRDKYVIQSKSIREISLDYGVRPEYIWKRLRECGYSIAEMKIERNAWGEERTDTERT